ncbi:MAG: NAD+ synthase [Deltaproteobacteria bacterium]|nr:NAD+ synthase [Deltaproteobacteria bacterium]
MLIRLGLAQINLTVGDLQGNVDKIIHDLQKAKEKEVDIVLFPELAITGYPPEDLLLKLRFVRDNQKALQKIVPETEGITAVVGFVDGKGPLYNAAAILHNGKMADIYHKTHLPNYGVFDEKRYFESGKRCPVYLYGDIRWGVNICEDIWIAQGPARSQCSVGGAQLILNINSSPYHAGKWAERQRMLCERALQNKTFIAYNNLVGGQDELVFDGHSLVIDPNGNVVARGEALKEEFLVVDLEIPVSKKTSVKTPVEFLELPVPKTIKRKKPLPPRHVDEPDRLEEIYRALVLGLKDYFRKNRFEKAALGLSGGIDSALTAVIAADALGKENVTGVMLPSRYTSQESRRDAEAIAKNLSIALLEISIEPPFETYLQELKPHFKNRGPNIAEENLQARIRGNLLMALSNKFGWLVLTTGNKSEMSVGYATLYGDMAGGFAILKDVPKMLVYELSRYRNSLASSPMIPESILTKPPTAELKANQTDQDTLPPYEILDPIIQAYVEEDKSCEEIAAKGFDAKIVQQVIEMIDRSEYKRRQAAPGIKITPKAYGKDRRMPITNAYKPTV